MFTTYFKTAWRYLIRNRVSSIINMLGLSLGITCCLVIFMIIRRELSFDNFHPDKERIYRLVSERGPQDNIVKRPGMLNPMLEPLRDEITGLETIAVTYLYEDKVRVTNGLGEKLFAAPRYGIDPFEVIITHPAYFEIFQYEWLAGSPASLNDPCMVVLTADKAFKYFGDLPVEEYIGKEIKYGDAILALVAGIVKPLGKNTNFIYTDFISCVTIPGSELKDRIDMNAWGLWNYGTQIFTKLLPDVEPANVEAQFPAWADKYISPGPNTVLKLSLQPLTDIHFNTSVKDDYMQQAHLPTLYGLMAIAAFILIIAACNFINLSTAQSMQRTREIGVRKVLGGKRINLITQMLGETLLVTSSAAFFSLLLATMLIDLFHSFVPPGLAFGLLLPSTWLFLLAVIVCTTLLAGIYPANLLSRVSPVTIINGATHRGAPKSLLRKLLIVFQFIISLVLIICTLTVGNQIHYMLNKDLGFDNKEAIINIRINRIGNNREALAGKIKQFPYVEMVSIHTAPPAHTSHNSTVGFRAIKAATANPVKSIMNS